MTEYESCYKHFSDNNIFVNVRKQGLTILMEAKTKMNETNKLANLTVGCGH